MTDFTTRLPGFAGDLSLEPQLGRYGGAAHRSAGPPSATAAALPLPGGCIPGCICFNPFDPNCPCCGPSWPFPRPWPGGPFRL